MRHKAVAINARNDLMRSLLIRKIPYILLMDVSVITLIYVINTYSLQMLIQTFEAVEFVAKNESGTFSWPHNLFGLHITNVLYS